MIHFTNILSNISLVVSYDTNFPCYRLNLGDQVPTYNYAFDRKKWKLGKYFDFMITCDIKLNQAIWKPVYIITNNPSLYIVLKFFLHTIPAFFIDTLLALYGSRFRYSRVAIVNNCESFHISKHKRIG